MNIQQTGISFNSHINGESYQEIRQGSREIKKFGIKFKTPAYFAESKSDFYSVFPEPKRVMMNLLRVWNAFSDSEKIRKEDYNAYRIWLEENVGVAWYDLRTMPMSVERAKAKFGFVGEANYIIGKDGKYAKLTDALLSFSKYANIGGERASGMGVMEYRSE